MEPVNWLAVILAANVAVAVGIVWYGPLFRAGRPLLEGPGRGAAFSYGVVVAAMLVVGGDDGPQFRADRRADAGGQALALLDDVGRLRAGLRLAGAVRRPCPARRRAARRA